MRGDGGTLAKTDTSRCWTLRRRPSAGCDGGLGSFDPVFRDQPAEEFERLLAPPAPRLRLDFVERRLQRAEIDGAGRGEEQPRRGRRHKSLAVVQRSEERRGGKEGVSQGRSRWSP